jgi:hypothetical protein
MKNKSRYSLHLFAFLIASLPFTTIAQLKITEVESSEAGGVHDDWWELTNLGSSSVDLSNYRFNDDTGGFATGAFVLPSGLSIGSGESMIFVESTTSQPMTVQGFRDWWGGGLSASAQIVVYSGSGFGLGSGGDQVNLWDSGGALVDGVVTTAATAGTSFVFDSAGAAGRSPAGLSQAGNGGAFTAAQNGDIGSPAVAPEPSVFSLIGFCSALLLIIRRKV